MESQSKVFCPDNTIMDITDSLRLFGTDFRISIMNEKVAGNAIPGYDLSKVEKAKKQIAEIRASKSFKVGFALTLPVRILKQLLVQTLKVGPQQAISLVGRRDFMAYKRDNPLEELHTLKESLALKVGDRLAIPFRLVHGRKKQSVKYRLEEQKKELNSIKRILQDSIRANQKTAEKIEQILEKQNQTNPLVPVAEKIDSIQQNVEELSKKVSEIAFQNGGQRTDAVENPKKFQPHTVMPIAESINSIQKKDRKNKREFK